jgi:EAL domain-containing protein (putative c-di-GMP-specific phosphodiesterase class I)
MTLDQLVAYFNHKFEQEHRLTTLPMRVEQGVVSGLSQAHCFQTLFTPIYSVHNLKLIVGYAAHTATNGFCVQLNSPLEIDQLINSKEIDFEAVIQFDRLCRTVHVLNALSWMQACTLLVLKLEPGHILGLTHQHGAYFDEVIKRCGLQSQQLVLSMTVNGVYPRHYAQLASGLNNYRQRGYRIALNIGYLFSINRVLDFITQCSPDYVSMDIPHPSESTFDIDEVLRPAFAPLKQLATGQKITLMMQQIKQPQQAAIAQQLGFDLVEGSYYQSQAQAVANIKTPQRKPRRYSRWFFQNQNLYPLGN